jgi:hypothetical protein
MRRVIRDTSNHTSNQGQTTVSTINDRKPWSVLDLLKRLLIVGNAVLMAVALLWVYAAFHCTWVDGEIWADHGDQWEEAAHFLGTLGSRAWLVLTPLAGVMVLRKAVSWKYLLLALCTGLILWKEYFLSR